MTPNKYNKLRKKIIEAVPGIVELGFGCKLNHKDPDGDEAFDGTFIAMSDDIKNGKVEWRNGCLKLKDCEILGRPINLADVLIAIGKNQTKWRKESWFTWVFAFAEKNIGKCEWAGFHGYSHKKGWAILVDKDNTPVGWNLKTNTLKEQTPETLAFLYGLLVGGGKYETRIKKIKNAIV